MNEYAAEFQKFLNLSDEEFEEFLQTPYFDRIEWERRIQINQQMVCDAGKSYLLDSFQDVSADMRNSLLMTTCSSAMRHAWVAKYSWAIPSDIAIDVCLKYSPILDFAAGGGYWSSLLKKKGAEVVCIDETFRTEITLWEDVYPVKNWMPIQKGCEDSVRGYPRHTLLMIWPPYATSMARNALYEFRGDHIIYVGEGHGGCTGDDEFHELLEEEFALVEECDIPQHNGVRDYLMVYKRRRPRSRHWTFYKRFDRGEQTT